MAALTKGAFLLLWICILLTSVTAIPWPFSWLLRWKPPVFQLCPTKDLLQNECYRLVSSEYNCTTVIQNTCPGRRGRRGIRYTQTVSGPCHARKKTTCKDYTCERMCCEGWQRNIDGRCTLREGMPVAECHNGGTASGSKCLCVEGFTGSRCETSICKPACMNGGVCDYNATLSKHVCVCNRNFTGPLCEQVRCGDGCRNGGTCVGDNGSAKCLCPLGYTGLYCESRNIKTCSDRSLQTNKASPRKCNDSEMCRDWETCCIPPQYSYGVCLPLLERQTCTMDGEKFPVGQNITSGCEICHCHPSSSKDGQIICSDICTHKSHRTSLRNYQKCCQDKPDDYIKPVFLNCPRQYEIVAIDTWGNNSFGLLPSNYMKAVDWRDQKLNVKLSGEKFQACASPFCLDHSVMAVTDPDQYGLQSHCEFKLRVIDVMKPSFISCPTNIYGFKNEKIFWPGPRVVDNVGIASVYLEQPYRNGSSFDVGTTILTYRAQDYQGNVAKCLFLIRIYSTDTDTQQMPDELRSRSYVSPFLIVGSTIVGALAIALLILAVILIRICKLKKQAASVIRRNRNEIPPSYDDVNATNDAIYKLNPPPYDIAAKDKLPEYSPKDDPPVYSDVLKDSDAGAAAPSTSGPIYENSNVASRKNSIGKFETTI